MLADLYNTTLLCLDKFYTLLWGAPLLILIMGVGLYLTVVLRGIQFRYLAYALKLVFTKQQHKGEKGDISHFESLMTALAATIGIGNIAGISTAIVAGGMGALFWMWVTAIIGMATRFAESILAVKYRTTDTKGEMCGGPMYFIQYGLGWRWLSTAFAFCGAIAAFGGGNMLQANSVADVLKETFSIDPLISGVVIAVLTGMTILGGIRSIGKVASFLVPMMVLIYISGAGLILLLNFTKIPGVFLTIFESAFTGQAAVGGFLGSTIVMAIQMGVSRGLMTSEAGLGTASIAAAAAQTDVPGRQALVSMTGCFLATIVMCTLTGLVLGVTDILGKTGTDGKLLTGAAMTMAAFKSVIPWGGYIVTTGLILFAFTTLVGYAYYGEKCCEYLFGEKLVPYYRILFTLIVIPGAVLELEIVWKVSDIFNGMMAIPNLIGIMALSKIVIEEKRAFTKLLRQEAIEESA
ncbi:alanine/glycine:cation symporter family protein [Estrella lausannensis]|uniref:Sodium/alanine symporter AgcS n=1 Tax=Estrella lausannensis TaxID=483423 RepID=A0A0H5DNX8_9BACT|nr:sodium:alanine symporter family protein [Estrella lausannensis]CRX38032.1 Sodium/alanine symporter AgcS [Estrella lausannensis]